MAELVHPTPTADQPTPSSVNSGHSILLSGTYVIQIPKDQVYRVPPPENATRFDLYTRSNNHHSTCRRFLCWILLFFAIASAFSFLILRPVSPHYSILAVHIHGIKPTSLLTNTNTNTTITPEFNLTLRAENPNKNVGIYYENKYSNVTVYFSDVMLFEGALLPAAFYQPSSNVTVMAAKLKGSGMSRLWSGSVVKALMDSEKQGKVGFRVNLRAPVKLKVYSGVKTWRIRAVASCNCNIWVNNLTPDANILEKKCDHRVKLW